MEDISQTEVTPQLSELEQNALNRKRRLQQFRQQLQAETAQEEEEQKKDDRDRLFVTFRSYKPVDIPLPKEVESRKEMEEHNRMFLIEEKIQSQLEDALDSTVQESVDVNTLAPRKIDWDLKRAIQDKISVLDRRTQKAIAQLIRERLESGNADLLASAVNSAARAEEYQEE